MAAFPEIGAGAPFRGGGGDIHFQQVCWRCGASEGVLSVCFLGQVFSFFFFEARYYTLGSVVCLFSFLFHLSPPTTSSSALYPEVTNEPPAPNVRGIDVLSYITNLLSQVLSFLLPFFLSWFGVYLIFFLSFLHSRVCTLFFYRYVLLVGLFFF